MIIIVCCITIFITYILMFSLITYYFIKKRPLLNELFSIDNIMNTLVEIFACPEHFIIYIPGIIFENTPCVEKKRIKNETKEKIRIILTKINKLLNKMNDIEYDDSNDDFNDDANNTNNMTQVKWVLEGTLENFNHMYDETAEFYTKLSGSYSILSGKENKKKSIDSSDNLDSLDNTKNTNNTKNTKKLITLEKYVLIENNIEHCDSILSLLELIDYKDNTMFQIENNYILCLIYNLIESVRIYKLRMIKLSI